jgi:penicillin amidase
MLAVPPVGNRQKQAYARLATWDGRMDEDRPEPLIFTTWLNALDKRIYADELGELYPDLMRSNPLFVEAVLTKYPRWCDDVATPEIESCNTQISAALDDAIRGLRRRFGDDMTGWRRSAATRFQRFRPALRWLGAVRSLATAWLFPSESEERRVEAGRRALARLNIAGAGLRAIYDLSDLDRSVFMISPGQSDNPLSPHYDDLAPLWRGFDWIRLPHDPKGSVLRLVPPA